MRRSERIGHGCQRRVLRRDSVSLPDVIQRHEPEAPRPLCVAVHRRRDHTRRERRLGQASTDAFERNAVTRSDVATTCANRSSRVRSDASWFDRGASAAMGSAVASLTTRQW